VHEDLYYLRHFAAQLMPSFEEEAKRDDDPIKMWCREIRAQRALGTLFVQ